MALQTTFKNIQVGAGFYLNGNWYVKRSSRTADMYTNRDDAKPFRWFYVRQNEICTKDRYPKG
jgi:hypothetical protein